MHLVEDRADLPNVIALNSFLVNAARVIGPALAGLLLAVVSEAVCFALNALSFVAVIVAIGRMRWAREPGPAPWEGGFWSKWVEGYRFVAGFAPARALLLLVAVAVVDDHPVFVADAGLREGHLTAAGREMLGFLLAAAGAGALASTLYLAGPCDDPRTGARDRRRGHGLRSRARGVRLPLAPAARARADVRGRRRRRSLRRRR